MEAVSGITGFNPHKIYNIGEKGSGLKPRGNTIQDYANLVEFCQKKGVSFEDDQFPCSSTISNKVVEWKRPHEIVSDPVFVSNGMDRSDINQGGLGDCWFLAALSAVVGNQSQIEFIAPPDQTFRQGEYYGIFRFRFWQYGRWIEMVVDDKLPTVNGHLYFLQSKDENEFWPALIEKAYAKLYGSYENLNGGMINEALEDLTGGLSVLYDLGHPQLFDILYASQNKVAHMGCAILANELEGIRSNGLVTRHAYTITKVEFIITDEDCFRLIRIRNPWGNDKEWCGPWCDTDDQNWSKIPEEKMREMRRVDHDGEFWMQFEHFIEEWNLLNICYPTPYSYLFESEQNHWNCIMFDGVWPAGLKVTSVRHLNQLDKFVFEIKGSDDQRDCKVIVALMQKNKRLNRLHNNDLAFYIHKASDVEEPTSPHAEQLFATEDRPNSSSGLQLHQSDIPTKQFAQHMTLKPGKYSVYPIVGPHGDDNDSDTEYLLRIYTELNDGSESNCSFSPLDYHIEMLAQIAQELENLSLTCEKKELNYEEAKNALTQSCELSFSNDTWKKLIFLADTDQSGSINNYEFTSLEKRLLGWKKAFTKHDANNSNSIDKIELRNALFDAGYNLTFNILSSLVLRYGNPNGELDLEGFVLCAIKIQSVLDSYEKLKCPDDKILLQKEEFFKLSLFS